MSSKLATVARYCFLTCCAAAFLLLQGAAVRADDLGAIVKRLTGVNSFAFGGVGFAGMPSKGEIDFKFILSQSPSVALASFETLYLHGNAQAKAYALVGVRKLNPNRYRELLANAATLREEVEVMRGCIGTHEPLHNVARAIDAGEFRFEYRK